MHLIRCDVPLVFIQFAIDELPTSVSYINLSQSTSYSVSHSHNQFKIGNNSYQNNSNTGVNGSISQYVEMSKLYSIVSILIRCFDVGSYCASTDMTVNTDNPEYLSNNPYSHVIELKQQECHNFNLTSLKTNIKLPSKLSELIYRQTSFIKKIIEDAPNMDDTLKLLKFLCWENMSFTLIVLNELLWMTAYHYSYELKPHLELLYNLLVMSDSWQTKRIILALKGMQNDRDGLFEIIAKSQNHYQKRAYQIIKMLVQLFTV
jgi:ubiquitin carboxyl-terminal hydrolase 9/24